MPDYRRLPGERSSLPKRAWHLVQAAVEVAESAVLRVAQVEVEEEQRGRAVEQESEPEQE